MSNPVAESELRKALADAGYLPVEVFSHPPSDWNEVAAAIGCNALGGWALATWLDEGTCSGAGVYEVELTNCRSEQHARRLFRQTIGLDS